jgi:hypothetical protein
LYAPGGLLLLASKVSPLFGIAVAPAVTLAVYGVLEILYAGIGIPGSWATIFIPSLSIGLLSFMVTALMRLHNMNNKKWDFLSGSICELCTASVYCIIGVFLTWLLFLRKLNGYDSISQLFDNAWHLGIIRKFVDTGNYSTLVSGNIVPTVGSSFYPTGWHSLVALVMSMSGVSIGIAENAVNAMIVGIVFPLSMYILARAVFGDKKVILFASAVTPLMFAAYPWRFLTFGPLYSNLLSYAVLPSVMTSMMFIIKAGTTGSNRIRYGLLFLVSAIGIAITQPNAIFTLGVLLAPYLFWQIPKYLRVFSWSASRRRMGVIGAQGLLLAMIVIVWSSLYSLPALQRTVNWEWPAFVTKVQAFIDVVFVGFRDAEPQVLLGILIFIGIIYTIVNIEYLWISVSYIIFCILYLIGASTDGFAKKILTGFWYHDAYRLGASAVVMGVLLSGLGIYVIFRVGDYILDNVFKENLMSTRARVAVAIIVVSSIMCVVFYPNYYLAGTGDITTPFGAIRRDVHFWNSPDEPKSYTQHERAFVDRVKRHIPKGQVVLNQPYDGSAYAYGIDGLNVYYKAWEGNWMGRPTPANHLISTGLNRVKNDFAVCSAVRSTGAQYLLMLDRSDYSIDSKNMKISTSIYAHYILSNWRGIDHVGDRTPGFSIVMSDGPMRLFKIKTNCM